MRVPPERHPGQSRPTAGKRLLDVVLAILLLPAVVPVCALCAAAIVAETRGAPLIRQRRVGRDRTIFRLYKLRTMLANTEERASHEIAPETITRVGRVLRRTKLDELPQVLNVLIGNMSFVGPRPCLPSQTEVIAARAARGVFDVRPGITGPAQLAGIDMSTPEALAEADARYIATRTLPGDLRLILATATGGGRGDAAGND